MSEIFVIGHRNPDTDAICSAIGYAEFKRRTGMPEAVAARCGDTNDRIDFVLETFGVPAPRFVADVSPKVRDVMRTENFSVATDATAAEALGLMDEHNVRTLAVLDGRRKCLGLLSLFKLSKFLFPAPSRMMDTRRVWSSLDDLARTLGGKLLCGNETEREEELILTIGAMKWETFAERLRTFPVEKLVVVVGDREDIQQSAINARIRVLIVTGEVEPDEKLVATARQNGVGVVTSPHDTSTTAALCR
ncbi:MAG TPA: DRTGG domain-containing protein, partial [Verrucomicrobiae bacterium]|nr:DRTGG domain-containing protein [Verrucomicrobiae bacterium]